MSQTKAQLLDGKSATIQFTGGSASAPSVSFTGDTNTGIYSPGADQVAISTGGSGRLFVDSNGNLGVGISSIPNYNANLRTVSFNNTNGVVHDYAVNGVRTGSIVCQSTALELSTQTNVPLVFSTNSAERMRLDSSGRLGVGTTSPGASLHAAGAIASAPTGSGLLAGVNSNYGQAKLYGTAGGILDFGVSGADANARLLVNNSDNALQFYTNNGGSLSERLRITSAGTALLQGTERLAFNTYVSDSNHAGYLGRNTSTGALVIEAQNAGGGYPITFRTSSTERVRITDQGLVGVGTSSPVTPLDIFAASSAVIRTATNGNTTAGLAVSTDGYATDWFIGSRRDSTGGSVGADRFNLLRGTTPYVTINSSGNVGVGTTSPGARVHSDWNGGSQFRASNGSATFDILNDSTNSQLISSGPMFYRTGTSGPHIFQYNNGSNEALRIDSSGRVGIGTSAPGYLLSAVSSDTSAATYVGQFLSSANPSGTSVSYLRLEKGGGFGGAIGGYLEQGVGSGLKLSTLNGGTLSEAVTITNTGRVGIGTTSPATKLAVSEPGATDVRVRVGNVNATFDYGVESGGAGFVASSQNAPYYFFINNSERARIDSSGRLLVGTSSAYNVEGFPRHSYFNPTAGDSNNQVVVGAAGTSGFGGFYFTKTRASAASDPTVAVQNNDALARIRFFGANGTNFANSGASIDCFVDGTNISTTSMPGRLVFSTTADGASSPTERMRISQNGNISFASTATGSARVIIGGYTNGDRYGIFMQPTADGATPAAFHNAAGTLVGFISTTASATTYSTSSDYRLKENVTPVTDGITRLQQLKPSRFNFISDPGKTVDGFIAHEVQAIVPEAITGEKDAVDDDGNPKYQGIDQSKLVPLLTAALQEAVAKIESLEARLTAAGI